MSTRYRVTIAWVFSLFPLIQAYRLGDYTNNAIFFIEQLAVSFSIAFSAHKFYTCSTHKTVIQLQSKVKEDIKLSTRKDYNIQMDRII